MAAVLDRGRSPVLKKCLDLVAKSARTDGNLFISGETGTGKDLIANAVHLNSERAGAPFISVDCTNLPDTLVKTCCSAIPKAPLPVPQTKMTD
jgi:two-component system NtrC family response regulator